MVSRHARSIPAILLLLAACSAPTGRVAGGPSPSAEAPATGAPLPAYEAPRALLRREAAAALGGSDPGFTAAAHTANATGRVQRYRQILVRTMESEGFTNYDQEWWHFSYPLDGAVPFDRLIR